MFPDISNTPRTAGSQGQRVIHSPGQAYRSRIEPRGTSHTLRASRNSLSPPRPAVAEIAEQIGRLGRARRISQLGAAEQHHMPTGLLGHRQEAREQRRPATFGMCRSPSRRAAGDRQLQMQHLADGSRPRAPRAVRTRPAAAAHRPRSYDRPGRRRSCRRPRTSPRPGAGLPDPVHRAAEPGHRLLDPAGLSPGNWRRAG